MAETHQTICRYCRWHHLKNGSWVCGNFESEFYRSETDANDYCEEYNDIRNRGYEKFDYATKMRRNNENDAYR